MEIRNLGGPLVFKPVMKIRILSNVSGEHFEYDAGQEIEVYGQRAKMLIDQGFAEEIPTDEILWNDQGFINGGPERPVKVQKKRRR